VAEDPVQELIDRVAEAVVRKIEEREKIDAIAEAVLQNLEARTSSSPGPARKTAAKRFRPKRPSKSKP